MRHPTRSIGSVSSATAAIARQRPALVSSTSISSSAARSPYWRAMRHVAHSAGVRIGIGIAASTRARGFAPYGAPRRRCQRRVMLYALFLAKIAQYVLCVIAGQNLDQRLDELPLIVPQAIDFVLQRLNAVVLFTCLPGHRYSPESWLSSWSS